MRPAKISAALLSSKRARKSLTVPIDQLLFGRQLSQTGTKGSEKKTEVEVHERARSGDIKSDCLGGKRFDAGIWSDNPDMIKSVVDFFNRVWEDTGIKKLDELK